MVMNTPMIRRGIPSPLVAAPIATAVNQNAATKPITRLDATTARLLRRAFGWCRRLNCNAINESSSPGVRPYCAADDTITALPSAHGSAATLGPSPSKRYTVGGAIPRAFAYFSARPVSSASYCDGALGNAALIA